MVINLIEFIQVFILKEYKGGGFGNIIIRILIIKKR
jgi:hypothetical protein